MKATFLLLVVVAALATPAVATELDFARDIQPLLARRCYACHGPDTQEGGLRLDDAAAAKVNADSDAKNIRAALGDIAGERARMLAEADTQAAAVLTEGRTRIIAEVAELEAKAETDLSAARGRSSDELRAEISMLAALATPVVVEATLTDQTKNDLIEAFITSVGAAR